MSNYRAPLEDISFLIDEVIDAGAQLADVPAFADLGVGSDLTTALMDEAAKLAAEVLAPLRRVGDEQGASCEDGKIILSPGFADAVAQLAAGGWVGISAAPDHGGQGLPEVYSTASHELWNGANMAFGLHSMLTSGAALALAAHGSEELKTTYLEKMNSGEWSGSMNLTEAGAGSDLGVMKTRAEREGDHYRIYGQKIFITWGDHEATDNIIHLVLAKLPDSPEGSRGISLFLVPKYMVNADGSLGERNDVYPVSTEHKLGIHGSPTCVMAFGDNDGAVGYLIGEENQGLRCMFTMMNEARLKVGIQALGVAEGSYQHAVSYAHERVQGGVPIIEHPDVKRMLLTMRALVEAGRGLAYREALTLDLAHKGAEENRAAQQARIDLMIPVIKAWISEISQEVTSLGVQVHGGMGYVEETGAAQYFRDARITPIYEGTNGIQAADLLSRKLVRDGGATMESVLAALRATLDKATAPEFAQMKTALEQALAELQASSQWMLNTWKEDPNQALGCAFYYLMQTGYVFGGWNLLEGALVAKSKLDAGSDNDFYTRKIATAQFYCANVLSRATGYAKSINADGDLLNYQTEWL
ncbi:MAG: acyl-CoA dehydrogenase [Gammaproteobacteria bacterium]|nr:MAG: acyl-CoA dehydrogenase [Gammaproteobacteria bacterium]